MARHHALPVCLEIREKIRAGSVAADPEAADQRREVACTNGGAGLAAKERGRKRTSELVSRQGLLVMMFSETVYDVSAAAVVERACISQIH